MKRKEEIEKAAMQVAGVHPYWSNLDCFRMGFREGAKTSKTYTHYLPIPKLEV